MRSRQFGVLLCICSPAWKPKLPCSQRIGYTSRRGLSIACITLPFIFGFSSLGEFPAGVASVPTLSTGWVIAFIG